MKQKIILLAVLAAAAIGLTLAVYVQRDTLGLPLADNKFQINKPYIVAMDSHSNIIMIDNRSKRLTKIKPGGEIAFSIDGGKRGKNEFYNLLTVEVDPADNIYIMHAVINMVDGYPEIYEIQRHRPDGAYDATLVHYERSTEERQTTKSGEFFGSILIDKGFLFYLQYKKNEGTSLFKVPVTGGRTEKVFTYPEKLDPMCINSSELGGILMTMKDGRILQVNTEGKVVPYDVAYKGRTLKAPWGLDEDDNDNLYISDIADRSVYRLDSKKNLELVADLASLNKEGYQSTNIVLRFIHVTKTKNPLISIVDELNGRVLVLSTDGKIQMQYSGGNFSLGAMLYRWAVWAQLLLLIAALVGVLLTVYFNILKRKLSVIFKMMVIMIPIVVGSIIVIVILVYNQMYEKQLQSLKYHVAMIAQIAADKFDGDALERITEPRNFKNADYQKLQNEMYDIFNGDKNASWNDLPYSRIYKYYNGVCYITVDWSARYGVLFPFVYDTEFHKQAYYQGKVFYTRYNDFDSDLIVGVAPIRNKAHQITGVYEAIIDGTITEESKQILFNNLVTGLIISLVIFIFATSLFAFFLLLNLRNLAKAINEVSGGNYDAAINIKSRDEVGDLGGGFNIMAQHLKQFITEITDLNKAYVKFVPSQFLKFLGKKSILDIRLGNQIQKTMSVLFSDIRSFTTLSESMKPEENFNFINAYLRRVGPVIRNHQGFIDKYIGDAIMALFSEKPEEAVKAGIEMKKKLVEYNAHRAKEGYKTISIGVGIHTGSLMLGIIGEEERMDGTVISDNVNLASRLEGLTKMYGAGIIISDSTLKEIDSPSRYNYRFLDKVKVKGKSQPVSIYEVMDGEDPKEIDLKVRTMKDFENALKVYQEKQMEKAMDLFKKIFAVNEHDKAIELYIERCKNYIKYGIPEDWEGVEELHEK